LTGRGKQKDFQRDKGEVSVQVSPETSKVRCLWKPLLWILSLLHLICCRCQNTGYTEGLTANRPTLLDQALFYSFLSQRCIKTILTVCQQFKAHIKFLCILTYFV